MLARQHLSHQLVGYIFHVTNQQRAVRFRDRLSKRRLCLPRIVWRVARREAWLDLDRHASRHHINDLCRHAAARPQMRLPGQRRKRQLRLSVLVLDRTRLITSVHVQERSVVIKLQRRRPRPSTSKCSCPQPSCTQHIIAGICQDAVDCLAIWKRSTLSGEPRRRRHY